MKRLKLLLGLLILIQLFFGLNIPKLSGRVNDYANLLTMREQQQLENILSQYEQQTTNQLAVLIVPTLGDEDLENYSIRVVEKWKLGQKGKDNGVLLLIALKEKKIRIEVGYVLEESITDAFSSSVIREIIAPAFRAGDYYQGIYGAVYALIKKTNAELNLDQAEAPAYAFNNGQTANYGGTDLPGKLQFAFVLALIFGFLARTGKLSFWRGFWGMLFLPALVFLLLGLPFSLPLLLLILLLGFPFTFFMILVTIILSAFGRGGGFYGGGFSSGGGFSGGGGSFGGGGSSGGW